MNYFDGCQGRQMPEGFAWMNEPPDWGFEDGRLHIAAPPNTDLFRHPGGEIVITNAPFLYYVAQGDFTVSSRIGYDRKEISDAGGIVLYSNAENWAKLAFEHSNRVPTVVSLNTRGVSDDANGEVIEEDEVYLRATRMGRRFAFHFSRDGKLWILVRHFYLEAPDVIRVGVCAQSPHGDGCRTTFAYLEHEPVGVADIRSGE
jgi:regulation of enolase protein 1 (concanavalin A-like superfamily)